MERKILVQLRNDNNLTQEQLGKEIGISTVYVRKLEKGVVDPGINTMIKYEKFFNKDMKKLFPDIFFDSNDKKFIKNETTSA
ncbi:helix-turn-helix transcriptional regulator [Alteribacillus sp. YIM 98480]|uniref:helix-turn-helix transcriptional regulator n=1 Tax=Alteribacillus sp. YIM 98480 TaxID=2606599 RepID=UPI001E337BBE|nr:helix-turn-helix transcriptional regulator [Alteribacillus sp. YIM 98480]